MKNLKTWILWIFVFLWMGNILSFSCQSADISKRQSGYFTEFVHKVLIGFEKKFHITTIQIDDIDHLIRKSAHIFNYFILTLLLVFALLANKINTALAPWFVGTLFSVFDEWVQTFIPGRSGMLGDVFIDQLGILFSLVLLYRTLSFRPSFRLFANHPKKYSPRIRKR